MRRALKVAGLTLVALVVVAAGFLAWLLASQSGARFAVARAQAFLPEGVALGEVHGRLLDELRISDVHVVTDTLRLTAEAVWLRWKPSDLLESHLQIHELGARGVDYQAMPSDEPPPPAEPFSLPEQVSLPVTVNVDRLLLEDARLATGSEAPPLTIERAALSAAFADSRLRLERVELRSPQLTADAQAEVTAAGDYPLSLKADWRLVLAGYAPVEGQTGVGGTVHALDVSQTLAAPYSLSAEATLRHLVSTDRPLSVDAKLAVDETTLAALRDDLPQATVSLTASAQGPLDNLAVQAQARGSDPAERRFQADLAAVVRPEAVILEQLEITQPGRDGRLAGQGRIALAGGVAADLTIRWQALRWPLTGEPVALSPSGSLTFEGPLDDYRLALEGGLEAAPAPPLAMQLSGEGSMEQIRLDLDARSGEARLGGQVNARWTPEVTLEASLQGENVDPAVLVAGWPGRVNMDVQAAVEQQGDAWLATVSELEAGGQLRGRPVDVTMQGDVRQSPDGLQVQLANLAARLGETRLEARGKVAEQIDVSWQLDSDDLAAVLPNAGGALASSGSVTGSVPRLKVDASASADGVTYGDYRLDRLTLEANVDLTGEARSVLELQADNAGLAGTSVTRVSLNASGTPADHQAELEADLDQGKGRLALTGSLNEAWSQDPAWRFTLTGGSLGYGELAPWQLAGDAGGLVTPARQNLNRQCWQAGEASVCFEGERTPSMLAASAGVEALGFDYFEPFLPEELTVAGSLRASMEARRAADGPLTASVELDTTAGELTLPALAPQPGDSDRLQLGLEPSRLTVDVDGERARGELALNLADARLSLEAETPAVLARPEGEPDAAASRPVSGHVRLDVPDVGFAAVLLPAVEDLTGSIRGDMRVDGTLGDPVLAGTLELLDGAVDVPPTGLSLENVSAVIEGRGREGLGLTAHAASGDGQVDITGTLSPLGGVPTAHLDIQGEDFEVLNNDDGRILVSPDLDVNAGEELIRITGLVRVPEASITPGARAPGAVTVSEDQVLVSAEDGEGEEGRPIYAEVRLILGDEVRFEGFGLTARIDGELLLDEEPATPTTATGELNILDGEYRAYGQGLVIEQGRIFFAGGPITQPAVEVRAVRRPKQGILVGARVEGTLESPQFELFSEPPMTQQEQLSYLILGRSLQETPDGQASAISQAALAMGLKGGDFLAKNIGEKVGLDTVGIETGSGEAGAESDPNAASLVVGKYLSPRLYVSYGIGLFSPESILELQYDISEHWKLITQSSGESTGADVLFTVEAGD